MKRILIMVLIGIITLSFKAQSIKASESDSIEDLETAYDTTIGVYGINTQNGNELSHHADERFGFASTYKAIASGILLKQLTPQAMNQRVTIEKSDIVTYSPITEKYIGKTMTLRQLIEASMLKSDNTANNKVIQALGGVNAFKAELRHLGDSVSEPQRLEPELNDYDPKRIADTTTPRAAATTLNRILTHPDMAKGNLQFMKQLMIENETGDTLIKAGADEEDIVGDKSGQGVTYATRNDLAFIYPKGQSQPIVLAVYTKQSDKNAKPNDEVIAKTAKIAINELKQ